MKIAHLHQKDSCENKDKSIAEKLEINQNNGYKSTTQMTKFLKVPVGAIQTVLIKGCPQKLPMQSRRLVREVTMRLTNTRGCGIQ